jgi:hypothetical protein
LNKAHKDLQRSLQKAPNPILHEIRDIF